MIQFQNAEILYDSVQHDNKQLIMIKGGHATPYMSVDKLIDIFTFLEVSLPDNEKLKMVSEIISSSSFPTQAAITMKAKNVDFGHYTRFDAPKRRISQYV